MTLAEARRLLRVSSNYALAKKMGVPETTVSYWKRTSRCVPPKHRHKVRAAAGRP